MTLDQVFICTILLAAAGLFLWGRWRHDVVALGALLACVLVGLVPAAEAFAGFGHPAVITVAAVLVLSFGLQQTGAVDALAQRLLPKDAGPTWTIGSLTGLGALLSAFMNNVGALALLMPVAIQLAGKRGIPPGKVLMPLAFGSILGGMTTLIGTPPNLIVSAFRAQGSAQGFAMFDFTPVGVPVALAGVAFIALLGWRIVPTRRKADETGFDTGAYLTEVRVGAKSKAAGLTLREFAPALQEADAQVVALARGDLRLSAPHPGRRVRAGDILVIEAEPESLTGLLTSLGLTLEEAVPIEESGPESEPTDEQDAGSEAEAESEDVAAARSEPATAEEPEEPEPAKEAPRGGEPDEVVLAEMVVRQESDLIGRTVTDIDLRSRMGLNLLALARQGRRTIKRLRSTNLAAGDVLLLQGTAETLSEFSARYACVPLAPRAIRIPDPRRAWIASLILLAAIGGAALGLLPAAISFAAGVFAFLVLRIIPARRVYEAVDWSVIVLLAALIPVAGAMATSGAADLLARFLLERVAGGDAVTSLVTILVVTMVLSDFMNNAATAAVVCPIALSSAAQLEVSPDPFLMAVAIGASCAFLTPIGHQNNTLILGPGGFRFGDYWKLGLAVELIVLAVGVPLLLWVWPL